jgi:hypothetical protein
MNTHKQKRTFSFTHTHDVLSEEMTNEHDQGDTISRTQHDSPASAVSSVGVVDLDVSSVDRDF